MNRLETGCNDKLAQWNKEAGLSAALMLSRGATAERVVYPTGLVRIKVASSDWSVEISPEQHRYLVKWNNMIGPNFPL